MNILNNDTGSLCNVHPEYNIIPVYYHGMVLSFEEIAKSYKRIEDLSKRLEMTDELIDLFTGRSPAELEYIVRLTKGEVRPAFEGIELGVAEKLAVKALYQVTLISPDEIEEKRKTLGDIGSLAEEIMRRKMQMSLFSEELTVDRVFKSLEKISLVEGKASQDHKLKLIAELLHDATPLEARYITRIVCGKMRLGIADMTIVDALSYVMTPEFSDIIEKILSLRPGEPIEASVKAISTHKTAALNSLIDLISHPKKNGLDPDIIQKVHPLVDDLRSRIKNNRKIMVKAYNTHPDLGSIANKLMEFGIEGLKTIHVQPGVPLRAMLGERSSSIGSILERMGGETALEYKYDGLRVQAHIWNEEENRSIVLFSRQLEDLTDQFPDVVDYINDRFQGEDGIVEGECVPVEPNTGRLLPFQLISQRRGRKHSLQEKVKEIPVSLIVFDCLYSNGNDMTNEPYLVRREALKGLFKDLGENIEPEKGVSLSKMKIVKDPVIGETFFNMSLEDGCEGIMAKSISGSSVYQAGSRGWHWIKYKKDYRSELSDTLDLVVIGAFHGSGRRKGRYGALLMASYDPKEGIYRSVCKLGSGFNDQHLFEMVSIIDELSGPIEHVWKNVDSKMIPDICTTPDLVLEVLGAEITFSPNHTCSFGKIKDDAGLALRFPRFTGRYRSDKGPTDATTEEEIIGIFGSQNKIISDRSS